MRGRGDGRRRAAATLPTLTVALTFAVAGGLAGCSAAVDRAHTVQTGLDRLDGVVSAEVAAPTPDRAASIAVTFAGDLRTADVVALVDRIAHVAGAEDYPSYRLDLSRAGDDPDVLVVDDTFAHSADEETVVAGWVAASSAALGAVTWSFEPGDETIAVASGGALVHDVTEMGRIGYGDADTTWQFAAGAGTFVVSGRMTPEAVETVQRVQRSVASPDLPVRASRWRLEVRSGHVLLALDVDVRGAGSRPEQLTIDHYGTDVRRLARTALDAVRGAGHPVWLQLRRPTSGGGEDLFGYLVTDQAPVQGRDRLHRGWDTWLVGVARSVGL